MFSLQPGPQQHESLLDSRPNPDLLCAPVSPQALTPATKDAYTLPGTPSLPASPTMQHTPSPLCASPSIALDPTSATSVFSPETTAHVSKLVGAHTTLGHEAVREWGYPPLECTPAAIARAVALQLRTAKITATLVAFTGTATTAENIARPIVRQTSDDSSGATASCASKDSAALHNDVVSSFPSSISTLPRSATQY
jgi:hypothetical protein